jgi:putative transposase
MNAVKDVAAEFGVSATCEAFGVSRATFYRHRAPMLGPKPRRASPARRLCDAERAAVLAVLHEPRFVDLAPAEVHATLIEEGRYMCSARTT